MPSPRREEPARPEEVAVAIAFLASPDASHGTGPGPHVDEGWRIVEDSS